MNNVSFYITPDTSDATALAEYLAQVEYRRVPIAEVNTFLIEHFLIGKLRLARDNAAMPDPVRAFLGDLLTGIQIAETFDGTNPAIRAATASVTAVLVQASVMTQDDADGFASLMLVMPDPVTLDDVARERRRMAADAELAAADEQIAPLNAARNDLSAHLTTWVQTGEGAMPVWGGVE